MTKKTRSCAALPRQLAAPSFIEFLPESRKQEFFDSILQDTADFSLVWTANQASRRALVGQVSNDLRRFMLLQGAGPMGHQKPRPPNSTEAYPNVGASEPPVE